MFGLFKKKTPVIPPFPSEIRAITDSTVIWCRSQIGDFLGREPQELPDYGPDHDVLVGSYVCGFMQGQFIVTGHLERWAKRDSGMVSVGFLMLAAPVIAAVVGPERHLSVVEQLPQIGPAKGSLSIRQMDEMGGADGMDHARGAPKQKGGLLRHYLEVDVGRLAPRA